MSVFAPYHFPSSDSTGEKRLVVGVEGDSLPPGLWQLFLAIAEFYPVEFRRCRPGEHDGLSALIATEKADVLLGAITTRLPTFSTVASGREIVKCASTQIRFTESPLLDECLRGRVLEDSQAHTFSPLRADAGVEILALVDHHPVWIGRGTDPSKASFAAQALPVLTPDLHLRGQFRGGRFLTLLPLLNFLNTLTRPVGWISEPGPACFVFDDPSLYSPSYGFVNYKELGAHVRKHNYHASVATIPLDCWRPSAGVLNTFRENAPRLSLLIHGNDHTRQELAIRRTAEQNVLLLAQALKRWDRLENEAGLEIARVMEAPHGAISTEMLDPMLALGYDAALGTPDLLSRFNPNRSIPQALGFDRADLLMSGFPMIPRIRLSSKWSTDVVLAAFLRQPVVLAGHHWDAVENFELLAEFARLINSFKGMRGASLKEIGLSNYKLFYNSDVLNVKMYSRHIRITVREGVTSLFVHRPWLHDDGACESLIVKSGSEGCLHATSGAGPCVSVPVLGAKVLDISSPPAVTIDHRTVLSRRFRLWPVARKLFAETRDRSAPLFYRARKVCGRPVLKLPE